MKYVLRIYNNEMHEDGTPVYTQEFTNKKKAIKETQNRTCRRWCERFTLINESTGFVMCDVDKTKLRHGGMTGWHYDWLKK